MTVILNTGLLYELNENDLTAKIIGCQTTDQIIIIPRSVFHQSHEYIITNISKGSFKQNKSVITIKFPEDSELRSISKGAFYDSNIKEITIPSKLENLEQGWCKYTNNLVTISISPKNQKYLKYGNNLIFGKSDQKSDSYDLLLFSCRDIESVYIPSNIKQISPFCFAECEELRLIEFSKNSELISIEKYAFYATSINTITIPSSCKTIGKNAFKYSQLKTVNFPQNSMLSKIEEGCFSDSKLRYFSIPPNVTEINESTFMRCKELKLIEIPENSKIQSIGKNAFLTTKIESIFLPEKLNVLENCWCNNTNFLVHISVSPKNEYFQFDNEMKILLKKSDLKMNEFNEIVFASRCIQKVSIPQFIKKIGSFAFSGCKKLESIEFPKNSKIESIDEYAFNSTSIEKISIPSKIEKIEEGTFSECSKLKAIEFSEDSELKFIGSEAFAYSSLETIQIPPKLKKFNEKWCYSVTKLVNFSISPSNRHFKNYKNDFILQKLNENEENNKDDFDVILFARRNIVRPFIPLNIKKIGSYSFSECMLLQTIEFENGSKLNKIDDFAFEFSSIKNIKIPSKIRKIGKFAFDHCSQINSVDFQNNSELTLIDEKAFCDSKIERITIPEKVKLIGHKCFQDCMFIHFIEILSDEIAICENCFFGCDNISIVSLPNANEISIGKNSFSNKIENFFMFIKSGAQINQI